MRRSEAKNVVSINLQGRKVDPALFHAAGLTPKTAEGVRLGLHLTGLSVEAERKRASLHSPDLMLHMLTSAAFNRKPDRASATEAVYTEQGLDVLFQTRFGNVELPPKSELWKALRNQREQLETAVKEAEKALERRDAEEFRKAFEKIKAALSEKPVLKPLADNLNNPGFWLGLFAGDGNVDVVKERLGFTASYVEEAELLMRIFALTYGENANDKITPDVNTPTFNTDLSKKLVKKLFDSLGEKDREALAAIVNKWRGWGMPGGSDPPKLLSLMALYERTGGEIKDLTEGAFKLWMEYNDALFKNAVEKAPHVRPVADKAYVIETRDEEEGGRVHVVKFAYPSSGGWEQYRLVWKGGEFYLECASFCRGELAKELGAEEEGRRYYLDTTTGKALYHLLTRKAVHTIALGGKVVVEKVGRVDAARIELLEVKENGDVRFRIWFYKWFETRPNQPYVDVEIKYDEKMQGFRGRLYANEAEGISRGGLNELCQLFTSEGLPVTSIGEGDSVRGLEFTGGFREELLKRIGYKPKATAAEPASVRHLGGLRFEVDGRVVEFEKTKSTKVPLYAVLQFGDEKEAIKLYRRLKAAGVHAKVVGKEVRLTDESYWGLLITSGATPEGYKRLYPLPRDEYRDLYVFKRVEGNAIYYYFAVRHNGVWRTTGGKADEKGRYVTLQHAKREVLEALREAVKKALMEAGKNAVEIELGEIGEYNGVYRVRATRPVLAAFEERALMTEVHNTPPEVRVEGNSIVVRHGGEEHRVEFALVKQSKGVLVDSSLYSALQRLGVRAEVKPQGVKLERDGVWGLLTAAVESALKRGEELALPQGVSLLKARPESGHYIFSVEAEDGRYVYSVLKFRGQWTAMGGKVTRDKQVELMHSEEEVARAHADAFNEMPCVAEGRCAKKEAKPAPNGRAWRFRLNPMDLEELGVADLGQPGAA